MRTRLRFGAAASIGLGALLLATVLASPALAWHSNVTVSARCLDGQVRVRYTVEAWEKDHKATVDVFYQVNGGEPVVLESDRPLYNKLTGHLDLANDTDGEITVTAITQWKDSGEEPSTNSDTAKLPKAGKCEESTTTTTAPEEESTTTTTAPEEESTTTTTAPEEEPTTTTAPGENVAPSTTLATTTTGGGELPFTGATAGPMLIAGIALVAGGTLFLMVSRIRDRHATR
jgi:hypothetical protein